MRPARRCLAIAVLLLVVAACGDGGSWERAACEPAKPQPTGTHPVEVDGRRALLHVPADYDGSEAYPLVLSWHGLGSTADAHLEYADFRPLAEDERFFVLVPQGAGTPARFNLGAGIVGDTDDVAFASALIDHVAGGWCLDRDRVYSAGVSNGAGMSALLGCRLGDRIAAVGLDALLLLPEPCATPKPVIAMMGDADLVVPIQGGRVNCCGGWTIAPAEETMARWAELAGCRDTDTDEIADDTVERTTWTGCDGGVEVRYHLVRGGGHTWPGGPDTHELGPTNQELDASEEMWRFFRRFSL